MSEYTDFTTGAELLEKCAAEGLSISEAMKQREMLEGGRTEADIKEKLDRIYDIMWNAVHSPIENPQRSVGGLIGGEARKLWLQKANNGGLCGKFMTKAVAYSMAVLEENATMGLIVAAPTAGSSGVLPGVLMAGVEERGFTKKDFERGVLAAGAIGYLLMRNSSVSGAEAGCQAEVGSAAAMTAGALVEILGGTPEESLNAASLAISNLLGLVCDPIAGLVEAPCQSRNTIGAANAIICADLVMSGVRHLIPFDEMAQTLKRVGRSLPFELRETAMGGCAATPTGINLRLKTVVGEEKAARLEPLLKA